MGKQDIRSEINKSNLAILVGGGILMLMLGLFLLDAAFNDEYPDFITLILGFFFAIIGLLVLVQPLFIKRFILITDLLIVENVFGTEKERIKISEIESYKEIKKKNKNQNWRDLTIYTEQSEHTISSLNTNYKKLRKKLIKGKKRNVYAEKLWHYKMNKRYGIGFLIAGLTVFYLFMPALINKNSVINSAELSQLKGIVSSPIEIKTSGKRGRNRYIAIELEEHPKFKFILGGFNFKATKVSQLKSNFKIGTAIELDILTEQYEKKIKKKQHWTFGIRLLVLEKLVFTE